MKEHEIDDRGLSPDEGQHPETGDVICVECHGSGTLGSGEVCPMCGGTGRLPEKPGGAL